MAVDDLVSQNKFKHFFSKFMLFRLRGNSACELIQSNLECGKIPIIHGFLMSKLQSFFWNNWEWILCTLWIPCCSTIHSLAYFLLSNHFYNWSNDRDVFRFDHFFSFLSTNSHLHHFIFLSINWQITMTKIHITTERKEKNKENLRVHTRQINDSLKSSNLKIFIFVCTDCLA